MKPPSTAAERLTQISDDAPMEIAKTNAETRAWRLSVRGEARFAKFYPASLFETRTAAEIAISSANLHPAIIPLLTTEECEDGHLTVLSVGGGTNADRAGGTPEIPRPSRRGENRRPAYCL